MSSSDCSGTDGLTLERLLPQSAVELDLVGSNKMNVIEQLLDCLEEAGVVTDRLQVLGDLQARERQGSTALGRGLAVPHAKTSGAQRPALAFGRCRAGVDFEALDDKPVYLVFLLIVPLWQAGLHLRVLSALNRFLRNGENRRQLLDAAGESAVRRLLQGISVR